MEQIDLRNNIQILNRRYPNKDMLTVREAMLVMGYKSSVTTKKYVPFAHGKVSKATLARIMCGK